MTRLPGTILPTAASLQATERYASDHARACEAVARRTLAGLERRTVGGETRYYRNATTYAVVGRQLRVLWFETRADGDYQIKL